MFGEATIDVAMNQPTPAEQVRVHMATPGFFEVLGVPALVGRTLTDDDAKATGTPPQALGNDPPDWPWLAALSRA